MQNRIFVGICNSQEDNKAAFTWSMLSIQTIWPISISRSGHPWDIVRNNRLIKQFLESPCDIFVKMDIDQSYPSDYLLKMVPLVEQYRVIGPLIYDRMEGNDFMPLAFENKDYTSLKKFNLNGQSGIIEIPYPHTNLFYHREVLEKIPMPWYEAYATPDGLDRANHVDFSFLDKIHQAGYKIYINLDMVVSHLSLLKINREFHERWNRVSGS